MKICLVTTFPPSRGGLSEYGLHIARELQRNQLVDLTILADEIRPDGPNAADAPELPGFSVVRCWSPDEPRSVYRLLAAIRKCKPDVVWFNLLFSTFGNRPANAFAGLTLPLLTRMTGRYTHVTLHHLMDTVDLEDLGVRFAGAYRMAGAVATRMLLLANSVSVLMPRYREILSDKYGSDNVHVRAHGILSHRPEYPDLPRRGHPHRILAFGKWGTYKRLELMIEAFGLMGAQLPNAKLVIAGTDHPQVPGYVESVRQKCAGNPNIEFTGYVHEDDLRDLFQSSSVAVMPYSSSTGCSGVAHLACGYGVPIVCADLEDFRQMATGEDLAIDFYQAGDAESLASCLVRLLENPEKLRAMAEQNFSSALRMTMPTIVQKYLRHFELQQRLDALRHVSRFHRMPKWLHSRSILLRALRRKSESPVDIPLALESSSEVVRSGNGNGNGRGKLGRSGTSRDGDGINGRDDVGRSFAGRSAAGGEQQSYSDGPENRQSARDASAAFRRDESETDAEGKNPSGIQPAANPSLLQMRPQVGGGNGKNGTHAAGVGRDGSGREAASQNTGQIGAGKSDGRAERSGLSGSGDREAS